MQLRMIIIPVMVVGMLQMAGCSRTAKTPAAPLPGGTYISQSAGGLFQQSVQLADGTGNISGLTLLSANRPAHQPQDIYIAAGKTGLVHSADSGNTWTIWPVPLLTYVSDVVALDNGVVVASGTDTKGQGYIIRTIDQGKSWEAVLTIPSLVKTGGFKIINNDSASSQSVVIAITPDPFHPDRVYAGTTLGNILVGEQSAKTWRTLYTLSTSAFVPTDQTKLAIRDVIPSPYKDGEVLVITGDDKLFRISNNEQTELKIPQDLDKPSVYTTGQNHSVLSASYVANLPNALFVGIDVGAVLSRDAGKTWQKLDLPVDTAQKFNTAVVTASPTNTARLFVGINSVLYRSEDGGQTWNSFSLELTAQVITSILIDPTQAANILIVTTPAAS